MESFNCNVPIEAPDAKAHSRALLFRAILCAMGRLLYIYIECYSIKQSGTKPNFWLPTLVTFGQRLPKLVAKISSDFHHLVNTGLAVGSLVKWLPIKVANHSKIDKFEWFIARRLQMAPSDCSHL